MTSEAILIKPHHFVDVIRAIGKGQREWQPHPFGHNLHEVAKRIVADRDVRLQIELGSDDVCGPCIHNAGGRCLDVIDISFRPRAPRSKQEWNLLIDRRWSRVLGLTVGDCVTARQLCEHLGMHMSQLPDIYLELSAQRLAIRAQELQRGIKTYLNDL